LWLLIDSFITIQSFPVNLATQLVIAGHLKPPTSIFCFSESCYSGKASSSWGTISSDIDSSSKTKSV